MHYAPKLCTVVDAAVVLAPGHLGGVPVEILHREAVMDADLGPLDAGELQGALALHTVHGQPQSCQNVPKGHLPEGEDRLRGDRKLATALLAFEALPSDRIAVLVSAVDAHGTATSLWPADQAKDLEGIFLGDLTDGLKREGPAVRRKEEVLVAPIFLRSVGPPGHRS